MAERIKRSRRKGWRMPPNAVYVGRPTMWGNYAAMRMGISDQAQAAEAFRHWLTEEASYAWKGRAIIELRGKDLACWCKLDRPCHADVLLDFVNNTLVEQVSPDQPGKSES